MSSVSIVIFLFILFILGYRFFSYNLTIGGIFVTILLGVLGGFGWLKSLRGFIVLILAFFLIVVLPKLWPRMHPEITKRDKVLFFLGYGLGRYVTKTELGTLEDKQDNNFVVNGFPEVLKILKCPYKVKKRLISQLEEIDKISQTFGLSDVTNALEKGTILESAWADALKKCGELRKSLDDFIRTIEKRRKGKGYFAYTLGNATACIRYYIVLKGRGVPVIEDHFNIQRDNFRKFYSRNTYCNSYFPKELCNSINYIAAIDIDFFNEWEEAFNKLYKIGELFGALVTKEPY